ncbi:MAG TPA: PAS domain-containing protein [Anaerolineales bacterium]|nr:PAS domain-containing protein [Anaerolineales bacterium]HNN13864.1 PAS domain-containing protein [Anaerolineales bacterium]
MLEQVKRWFEPPVFPEDEDKTRKARILSVLLVSILGLMVPAVLAMLFVSVQKMGIGLILFCLLALVFVSAILMRKGRVQTASGIFVAGLWLLFTLMYVLGGRTTSSAASLLVAVIVISGLLLGERLTTILAVLSCLIGLGLAALESTGFPLIHYFPGLPIPSWVTWTFAIFLTLKPLNLAIDSITRSAETLRESEERLKFVLEGSQLGYWDWNMETGAVQRNSYWAEMLGYTLEEIQTTVTQWTDLHHPDDRALAWKSLQDHLDGKAPRHKVEYRMRTRDGQYKWILDQAKVVARGSHGQPIRMSGTHTDITDRKHIEEAEHKQRALAEAMSDSAAILNSTLNFEDVLDRIMDNVGRVLPHDAVGIILLDETGETANITRYHDNRSEPWIEWALNFRSCRPVIFMKCK